jgi:hypothetical protein
MFFLGFLIIRKHPNDDDNDKESQGPLFLGLFLNHLCYCMNGIFHVKKIFIKNL